MKLQVISGYVWALVLYVSITSTQGLYRWVPARPPPSPPRRYDVPGFIDHPMSFMDPVQGEMISFQYKPMFRAPKRLPRPYPKYGSLSNLRPFPGSRAQEWVSHHKFATPMENSYMNDEQFFTDLLHRRKRVYTPPVGHTYFESIFRW